MCYYDQHGQSPGSEREYDTWKLTEYALSLEHKGGKRSMRQGKGKFKNSLVGHAKFVLKPDSNGELT